jgi:2-polyprenyl-3-methyl-5-hydroxy-6-metoxy-1,4-benzoquinol methylase
MAFILCRICDSKKNQIINPVSYFFPTTSSSPDFHQYHNYYCGQCGIIYMHPLPSKEKLVNHYQGSYRKSDFAISTNTNSGTKKLIDLPIKIPLSGYSFLRFENFIDLLEDAPKTKAPTENDLFIDYGGYQGFFLYAVKKTYGCKVFNYDFSQDGIRFAKGAFDIEGMVASDIESDIFPKKAQYVSLVHVFEHLISPNSFLCHLKKNVLHDDGILYIEVPNAFGYPMSDPTHFFTYTEASIRNILMLNGFEVIKLKIHGNPQYGLEIDSDRMNISLLARQSFNSNFKVELIQPLSHDAITSQLKSSYLRIHLSYSLRIMLDSFKQFTKSIASFGIYFLEKFFKIDVRKIKDRLIGHKRIYNQQNQ